MCLAQRKAPGRNEAAGALEVLGLLARIQLIKTMVAKYNYDGSARF